MRDLNSLGKSPEINAFQRKTLLLVRDISSGEGVEVLGEVFPAGDDTYVHCSCNDLGVEFYLYFDGANLVGDGEDLRFEVEGFPHLSALMREFLDSFARAVSGGGFEQSHPSADLRIPPA